MQNIELLAQRFLQLSAIVQFVCEYPASTLPRKLTTSVSSTATAHTSQQLPSSASRRTHIHTHPHSLDKRNKHHLSSYHSICVQPRPHLHSRSTHTSTDKHSSSNSDDS